MRVSRNNGSSYDSTNNHSWQALQGYADTASTRYSVNTVSYFVLSLYVGNTYNTVFDCFFDAGASDLGAALTCGSCSAYQGAGFIDAYYIGGLTYVLGKATNVQIFTSTGVFSKGSITLVGIA